MTSKPHSTLSDMLTKNITEVVVYFRSDEDGMKRYEEFTAKEFRSIFEQLEASQAVVRAARDMAEAWEGIGWDDRTRKPLANLRYQLSRLDSPEPDCYEGNIAANIAGDRYPASEGGLGHSAVADHRSPPSDDSSPARRPT